MKFKKNILIKVSYQLYSDQQTLSCLFNHVSSGVLSVRILHPNVNVIEGNSAFPKKKCYECFDLNLARNLTGITRFDLLGDFGRFNWLGNFYIVLSYNLLFAIMTTLCLVRKFTSAVREELLKALGNTALRIHSAWPFPFSTFDTLMSLLSQLTEYFFWGGNFSKLMCKDE